MKYGIRGLCLLLCLSLAMLGGCQKTENGADRVRLCEVTHSVFYAPQYAAINLGFFEEENIDLELSNGEGADKVMSALLSDGVDIGFAGPEAAIYVYNEGKEDYAQVFAQLTQRDGSFLLAREPDDSFTWDKLRGKTILPGRKGGVPYMTLEYTLRQKGIDPATDVTLDNSIQFALMASAFVNGNGDYVTLFEPTASTLEMNKQGYIVASVGAESGEIPYTAYFAKKSYLKENADVVERFTRALWKGQQWVATHSAAEIAEVIAPSFPDSDKELLTTVVQRYKDIDAWSPTPVLKEEAFDRLQEVMTAAGELSQKAPYDKVVTTDIAKKVSGQ